MIWMGSLRAERGGRRGGTRLTLVPGAWGDEAGIASKGVAGGEGGRQAGEGCSVPEGLRNQLCTALSTGQVRQVWRIDHWTFSTHMTVTSIGVILGTKVTAGDSGESGKGVIRVASSFACKMGSSWREISGQRRLFIQVGMPQEGATGQSVSMRWRGGRGSRQRGRVGLREEQGRSSEVRRETQVCAGGRLGSRNTRCFCLSHTLGYYAHFSGEEAEVRTGQVPTIRQWN